MAQTNLSKVDEYGFERPPNFDYKKQAEFFENYLSILNRRQQRWKGLNEREKNKKTAKLKRFIRKGIPMSERPMIWMFTSGGQALKDKSKLTYEEMKSLINDENLISMIKLDVPRTFPENIFFTKDGVLPKKLFNVCATFAHQNAEVTYCQGLNYIAGLLLLATKDEEVTFWLLKALVDNILPKYYIKTMSGLLTDLAVLDELVKLKEPLVHNHLVRMGVEFGVSSTKWFICLYSEVLPTETVLRIWDSLFCEGSKILFRVALTLIKIHRDDILCTNDFGEVIDCFKRMGHNSQVLNCHSFMEKIFTMPGSFSSSQLEKLRLKHANTH
ncbi:growth hormone-regulated TBC protein 1-A-like [Onthophagus taurus]|uniref:growth hormone-regulated TBC protein 1-A-like n=1 Tax=Onthophagus taurus TaxID=166361 RepID=UPI000C2057B0|nr:growth hormone-regulated TBC protein 1-A-like [Onthophagus taurus]